MKLKEILDLAAEAYGDFPVEYDDQGQFKHGEAGDTLAEFIVAEITDTYSESSTAQEQLSAAGHAMSVASIQLSDVCAALDDKARELELKKGRLNSSGQQGAEGLEARPERGAHHEPPLPPLPQGRRRILG